MDAFSYLSVLLSIIIGLAITQVLQGYRAMLLARRRVKPFVPTLVWSVLIPVLATQSWWSSFGLAGIRVWTFGVFGLILLQTVLLYMLAALVLPDASEGTIAHRPPSPHTVAGHLPSQVLKDSPPARSLRHVR